MWYKILIPTLVVVIAFVSVIIFTWIFIKNKKLDEKYSKNKSKNFGMKVKNDLRTMINSYLSQCSVIDARSYQTDVTKLKEKHKIFQETILTASAIDYKPNRNNPDAKIAKRNMKSKWIKINNISFYKSNEHNIEGLKNLLTNYHNWLAMSIHPYFNLVKSSSFNRYINKFEFGFNGSERQKLLFLNSLISPNEHQVFAIKLREYLEPQNVTSKIEEKKKLYV